MSLKRPREDGGDPSGDLSTPARQNASLPASSVTESVTSTYYASASPPTELNPLNGRPYSKRYYDLLQTRQTLPVFTKKNLIQQTVKTNPVTLLVGETGSGKTTQIPHFLAAMTESFPGLVACTQPRRIAAISVASRVAEEADVLLGAEVGYHVRFDARRCAATRLLYMTDGMLLREAVADADLGSFSVIVVDEAHERTVDTDIVLGLLKRLLQRRPLLRLVVMSATLDVAKLQSFFPASPLLHVSGRMHPVEVFYMPHPVKDYVEASIACAAQLHEREPAGDILCFLTGEADIERAVTALRQRITAADDASSATAPPSGENRTAVRDAKADTTGVTTASSSTPKVPRNALVLPLYGSLSLKEQQKVFEQCPCDTRKVIFSTNIAETSVTIDGVVYVIDSGYEKQSLYNSEARVDYLLPAVTSKASAEQRKGRAGRTQPGKCYRMYTRDDFSSLPDQTHPGILRTNIANTILLLLKLGLQNPCDFPFLDPPSDQGLHDAFYQLLYYGAVDGELQLTDFGRRLADFPVDVCLARMLLMAPKYGCAADAAVVAAMLESGNAFARPPQRGREASEAHLSFLHPDGDHLSLFFIFHGYYEHQQHGAKYCYDHFLRHQTLQRAVQVYTQLRRLMEKQQIPIQSTYKAAGRVVDTVALRRAVLEGFFTQVAYLPRAAAASAGGEPPTYRSVRDDLPVKMHRHSVLAAKGSAPPSWVVFDRLEVQGSTETFIRVASAMEAEWLVEVSDFFKDASEIPNGEVAVELSRAAERLKATAGK